MPHGHRFARLSVTLIVLLVFTNAASAATTEIRALLDLDNDVATGCSVMTVDGAFAGVEMIHTTTVDATGGLPTVTGVETRSCIDPGTDTFGPPVAITSPYPPPWPVGIGNGIGGSFVVESYLPLSAMTSGNVIHVGFETGSAASGDLDALLLSGGNPMLIVLAVAPANIPTVGEWGLIFLGLLLVITALVVMRNRPETRTLMVIVLMLGGATVAYAAGFVLDGMTGDWTGEPQLGTDATGDAPAGDLAAAFAGVESDIMFLRYDIVNFANEAPIADDQAVGTTSDTAVAITLTATDPDGDPLTYTIETSPTNGALSGTAPDLTYTPDPGYFGPDSFTFSVDDGELGSNIATVTITVVNDNTAPVVADQTLSVPENSPNTTVVGTVVASDVDGDMLSWAITAGNGSGAFAIDAMTGQITVADGTQLDYETTPQYVLTVQVTDDGNGNLTDTATITVDVTDVNETPVAVLDGYATPEDTALIVAAPGVLDNDTDPDSDALTAVLDTDVSDGTLVLAADGSFTYTPDLNFNGADSFTYHANDGTLDSNVVTVTITVNALNDDPAAVDDADATDSDTALNIPATGVLANDTDPDSDPLTVTGFDATSALGAAVNVNADGSFSYDPTGAAALQALDDTEMVADTFTYTIGDGNGGVDTATVTVTVSGVNDAPVAIDDAYMTDEDNALIVSAPGVLANDTDIDVEALTVVLDTTTSNGSLTLNADGSFSYTPNANFNGSDSFTYRANDGSVDSNLATVTITVNPVNDAPVADDETISATCNIEIVVETSAGQTATASGSVSRTISDNVLVGDSDPVEGTAVTLIGASGLTNDTTGPEFTVTTNQGGAVTLYADGSFIYTPESGDRGVADSFTYTIEDAEGGQDTATVTLNVGSTCVWFVDNSNNGGADDTGIGTSSDPFTSLVDEDGPDDALADDAEDAALSGDVIYVFAGNSSVDPYVGGYTAKANQTILGEGVDLVVDLGSGPETLFDSVANVKPLVQGGASNGFTITDLTGVELAGFDIESNANAVAVTTTAGTMTSSIHDNTLDSIAVALTVTSAGGSLEVAIDDNVDIESDVTAVNLVAAGGTLYVTSFCGNTVSGNTVGDGIVISGAIFDADPSDADFTGDEVACGTGTMIGSAANRVGGSGLKLLNVTGDLSLGALDVWAGTAGGLDEPALEVGGNGLFNAAAGTGFQMTTNAGTIDTIDGPAIDVNDLDLQSFALTTVTSQNSGTTGLDLLNTSGSFQVSGTTTIGSTAGDGVSVTDSSVGVTFTGQLAIATTGGEGVSLDDLTGAFSAADATSSISGTTGDAFNSLSSEGNITYAGTITNTLGNSVDIRNHGGAAASTILFSGFIDDDGSGILLDSNGQGAGATMNFTGGLDLDTGTGTAFNATNGGTVNVTSGGVSTTADTTTGTVVFIGSTTIGASGVTFDSTSSTGGANGILLTNVPSGDFTSLGGSLANQTNRGVDISGGNGDVRVDASISTTSTGRSVEVTTHTGGTVDFNGFIDDNGFGIRLENNVGSILRFDGGMDIDTSAASGTEEGFQATGGGTVHVTGSNDVDTSLATGVAVNIAGGTTIGSDDVTFRNVSANGSANGIVLNGTGSTGAFEVTGTGTTDGTGGTIQSTTGDAVSVNNVRGGFTLRNMVLGDGTATLGQPKDATNNIGGDGIDLVSVDDVVFTNMRIARTNNHGIDGTDVTNFAISNSEIYNAGNDNGDSGISFEGVGFNNLDGTATVSNTTVDAAVEFGMRVQNSSGTLALTITGSRFSGTANTGSLMFGEDGLQIEVLGTAQTTASIGGSSTFLNLESDGIMGTTSGNSGAILNITIDGNTFTGFDNGAPNMRSDNAIELNATGGTSLANGPRLRYTINGNQMNSSSNSAILIGANDFTQVDGRITGNTITGSKFGFGIEAPLAADDNSVTRVLVTGNTISNHNQQGAFFNTNNSADLDVTFNSNNVATQPGDTTAFENVLFQTTSGSLCVAAASNTIALGGADAFGGGVNADALGMIRTGGTAQLERGSANLGDPASTVLLTNNPAAASVFAAGTITTVANSTCVTPIATPTP